MNNGNYTQPVSHLSQTKEKSKWPVILGCLGILGVLFVVIVLGGYFYLTANAASQSVVLIRSPQNGDRIEAGQPIQVRALARDEQKIVRIELWVDGQLIEAQTSNTPGGINPFPLLTTWNPAAGTHILIARSFNSRNVSAQTTITVETVALSDRDKDGVADEVDACPDQVGNPAADGCPDRDYDGIADASDACPDVAGMPEDGCPAPSEGDRDGDGMLDAADACPDEAGSPLAEGCIDTDGDGISDASDACPSEPGGGEDGCPVPGDTDGDSIPDADDACPSEPGGGDGCPDMGGGDALPPGDDVVPPGDDEDTDEDSVPGESGPFGDGGGWEAIDLVRLEALEFSVTQDYDQIYCYAGVVGRDIDRYGPFDSLGHHQWDIMEYMGGENSRTLGVEVGDPLVLRVECTGNIGASESRDLGSFTRSYDSSQWDGHVIEEISGATEPERGDPGHSFRVQFRLCYRTCETAGFPPPVLRTYDDWIGPFENHFLGWNWDGDRDIITGYRLYINGHRRATIHNTHATHLNLRDYMPECGERNEYTLTAYQSEGGIVRESPPSNSVYRDGETCPRRVKVTFEQMGASDMRWFGGDMPDRGPIYGTFFASGNETQTLRFDGGECWSVLWVFNCRGFQIYDGHFNISDMFNEINAAGAGCIGLGCVESYAPEVNYVIVELDEGDDLSFGGSIWDEEAYGDDERLFDDRHSIGAGESLPANITLEDETSLGRITLQVRVEEIGEP